MDIVVIAPNGTTGETYSGSAIAENGTPPYAYSVVSGALPDGLAYDPVTGDITGVPTAAGTFNWTAEAVDSSVIPVTVDQPITQTISTLVATLTLPPANFNFPYAGSVNASGGIAPYTFAIVSGALPAGLVLNSDGTITGTPTAGGAGSNITFQVTDSADATPNVVDVTGVITVSVAATMAQPFVKTLARNADASCTASPVMVNLKIDFAQLPKKFMQVWLANGARFIPVAYAQYDFSVSQVTGASQIDAVRGLLFNMNWWPTQQYPNAQLPNGPFNQLVIFNQQTGQEAVYETGNFGQNVFGYGQMPLLASPNDTISIRLWAASDSTTILGIGNFQFTSEGTRYPYYNTASTNIWGQN